MSVVRTQLVDGIAVVTLANPPVNALSAAVRQGVLAAIAQAVQEGAQAVILAAEGKVFSAGADISEFGKPPVAPSLPEVCSVIEDCPLPVVAAIQGAALGGGFELALAAHYRIATRHARVALPEVKLGLLPGAGGTQRLPRLVGASPALEVILSGEQVPAEKARALGMLDDVTDADAHAAAMIWAKGIAADGVGPRPTKAVTSGFAEPANFLSEIAAWRQAVGADAPQATQMIIDCVEASLLLPFDAGLRRERSVFMQLVTSDRARGLRHAFRAERVSAKLDHAKLPGGRVTKCAVVGSDTMAASITIALLAAGIQATLIAEDEAALNAALGRILDAVDRAVARGDLTAEAREGQIQNLGGGQSFDAAKGVDLILHTGADTAEQTGRMLGALADAAGGNPMLAVTRDMDLGVVAAATGRAATVAELLLHPPLRANPLVEVAVSDTALPDLTARLFGFVQQLGLRPILVAASAAGHGLVAGRLRGAMRQVAEQLLLNGASPEQIDAEVRRWGFRMGPCEAEDRIGLASAFADQTRTFPERDPHVIGFPMTSALMAAGRGGRATGAGWFRYGSDGTGAQPDPKIQALLVPVRAETAQIPDDECIRRWFLAAMANTGAWLLANGAVRRPLDIDVAALSGLGMARSLGGPMLAADLAGLVVVRQALDEMNAQAPGAWIPAELWAKLIKNGRAFDDLNT